VYDLIKSTPELLVAAKNSIISGIWGFLDLTTSDIFNPIYEAVFGGMIQNLTTEQKAELERIRNTPDFILFIKSFAIAYLLVKHTGAIISGAGDLVKFIASLFALKAA